ncbi:XRE family transcriptional regulator [Streptomyces sp. NPDC001941]|uniref:XRE family transcriptional regulator n=1 Tax=Streptomyces sp. NPDC001941 TaxID=3154659 RepID=UPI003320CB73
MTHLAARVGARVRELREGRGLSLSELARRAEIGKGTLSELEGGGRNPTLETLYSLTTALDVPLSAVLHGLTPVAEVSGRAVDAVLTERIKDDEAVTETYRIQIRPGSVQESAAHAPGTTEHIVVLTGTARVGPRSAPQVLGPGAHGSWSADVAHVYEAPSERVEALLVVRYKR